MANTCVTEITFYTETSNLNELEKLYKALTRVKNDKSYDKKAVSEELGFEMCDDIIFGCSIDDVAECISTDYKGSYFQIVTDSKWTPRMEIFDEMLKHLENIEYVLLAEEPGDEIYINTDTERLFYSMEYKMWVSVLSDSFNGLTSLALNFLGLNSVFLKEFENYSEDYSDETRLLDEANTLFSRKFETFYELKEYAGSLSKLTDTSIGVFQYASEL